MTSNSPSTPPKPFLSRVSSGVLAGLAVGLAAGAIEGAGVLSLASLRFANPTWQLVRIELAYGVAGALYGGLLGLILRRSGAHRIAGCVLGTLLIFAGLHYAKSELLQGVALGSGRGLATLGAAVAVALLCGFALIRSGPRLTALVAGGLGIALVCHALVWTTVDSAYRPRADVDSSAGASTGSLPNIVFLLVDTLRADRLSCYGHERETSPSIDALAARGTLFEASQSAAPWTRPSVASLMTSLYPSSHDVKTQWGKLPASLPTLAEMLQQRGYDTAGFSTNLQISPTFGFGKGFDYFWNSQMPTLMDKTAIGGWFRYFKTHLLAGLLALLPQENQNKEILNLGGTSARAVNKSVMEWLEGRSGDAPLFLYVHYLDPHAPYTAPEDHLNTEQLNRWELHAQLDMPIQRLPYPLEQYEEPSAETLDGLEKLYDAEIRFCDEEIGKLLARLDQMGLTDDAYVIFTSDHGEEFHDHTQWLHGHSLFHEMVGVPLIITGPDVETQRVAAPVTSVDLLPTMADWSGSPVDFRIHGRSLVPLLKGEQPEEESFAYSERLEEPALQAIRLGNRKLIRLEAPDGEYFMEYDLTNDPRELDNLAGENGKNPSADLRAKLEEARLAASAYFVEEAEMVELSEAQRAALEALGYLGSDDEDEEERDG